MNNRDSNGASINFKLIIIVLGISTIASTAIYLLVQSRFGVAGLSWILASLFWLLANFLVTYFDTLHREEGTVTALLKAGMEVIQLLIIATVIQFFLKFNIITGNLLFFIYTCIKMTTAMAPILKPGIGADYIDRKAIEDLERTGTWISEQVLELESLEKVKETPMPRILHAKSTPQTRVPVRSAPPKKLKLTGERIDEDKQTGEKKTSVLEEKVEKIGTAGAGAGKEDHGDFVRERLDDQGHIMQSALSLLSLPDGEKAPENLEDIIEKIKENLWAAPDATYEIPSTLSRSGIDQIDQIPETDKKIEKKHMDSRDGIRVLFLSILKDMASQFNMKLKTPVDVSVIFPWEFQEARRMKLTERMKVGGNSIIRVTGSLSEDFTYAILAVNLADIWFEENASPDVDDYKSGFHFWIAYKLLKKRGFFEASAKSARQNEEQFEEIREIEKAFGEFGVFYFITKGKKPDLSVLTGETQVQNRLVPVGVPGPVSESISEKEPEESRVSPEVSISKEIHPAEKVETPPKAPQTKPKTEVVEIIRADQAPKDVTLEEKPSEREPSLQKKKLIIKLPPREIIRKDSAIEEPIGEPKVVTADVVPTITPKEILPDKAATIEPEAILVGEKPPALEEKEETETRLKQEEAPVVEEETASKETLRTQTLQLESKTVEQERKEEGESITIPAKGMPDKVKIIEEISPKEKQTREEKEKLPFRKVDLKLGTEGFAHPKIIPLEHDLTRKFKVEKRDVPSLLKSGKIISLKTGEIEEVKVEDDDKEQEDKE